MKFAIFQRTERGARENNEDRIGHVCTEESALFVVADGMGGHACGELAAQLALECFVESFKRQALPLLCSPYDFLHRTMLNAHHRILEFAHEHALEEAPRTTLVALIIQDDTATWAHCGDSRLYWCRANNVIARTIDHSYAEQISLLRAERTAMPKISNRNVLFTCLGSPTMPIYDVAHPAPVLHNDRFLVCSDGLWGQITDAQLQKLMSTPAAQKAHQNLMHAALNYCVGRFSDNVSAILVECHAEQLLDGVHAAQGDLAHAYAA